MSRYATHTDGGRYWLADSCHLLTEAFRLALSPQAVLLSLAGLLLSTLGWQLSGWLFLRPIDGAESSTSAYHRRVARWPGAAYSVDDADGLMKLGATVDGWLSAANSASAGLDSQPASTSDGGSKTAAPLDPVVAVPVRLVLPFRRLLSPDARGSDSAFFLLGGIFSLAIWAVVGGAITRGAVVQLGLQQRLGARETLAFACRKWTALFAAPLLPLIGIALIALPFAVLGVFMRGAIGVLLASLLWVFVLLGGFLMALLALGLLVAWPLMWGTICAEDSDAFDAISRSYAYALQHPLHYLAYAVIAACLGCLAWLLAWGFSELVVTLTSWSVAWGGGSPLFTLLTDEVSRVAAGPILTVGLRIIDVLHGLVRAAASAFAYTVFWSAFAAIYLLLRRDTDQTEFDEIAHDRQNDEDDPGLPRMEPDDQGVPGVPNDEDRVSVSGPS